MLTSTKQQHSLEKLIGIRHISTLISHRSMIRLHLNVHKCNVNAHESSNHGYYLGNSPDVNKSNDFIIFNLLFINTPINWTKGMGNPHDDGSKKTG